MARLIVRNIGPIKDIDIELKKVNVFMGPQGCGKSTLAKLISFCSWIEKGNEDTIKTARNGLISNLIQYHRMGGYFHDDSQLAYIGDNISLYYQFPDPLPTSWHGFVAEKYSDKEIVFYYNEKSINPKVAYIPAERNFVSVVPNLKKYSEKDDSLQNFVNDWFSAKRVFTELSPLHIDILGIDYYYNEKTDTDMLLVDNQPIALNQSSSGFQSIVPLIALISYLSSTIYKENKPFSPEESQQMNNILERVSHGITGDMEQQIIDRIRGFLHGKVYTHTQFIVEEPEQNLFPDTQCELLYFLLSYLNHGKAHRLVLTTHSPYILYALNNCILANIVKDQMSAEEKKVINSAKITISPKEVAVWEIENGRMKSYGKDNEDHTIQDTNGLIRKNYFNNVMRKVMSDYNEMLVYKE